MYFYFASRSYVNQKYLSKYFYVYLSFCPTIFWFNLDFCTCLSMYFLSFSLSFDVFFYICASVFFLFFFYLRIYSQHTCSSLYLTIGYPTFVLAVSLSFSLSLFLSLLFMFLLLLLSLKTWTHFCHNLPSYATFNDIRRFKGKLFRPHVNRFRHKSKNVAFQYHFPIQNY